MKKKRYSQEELRQMELDLERDVNTPPALPEVILPIEKEPPKIEPMTVEITEPVREHKQKPSYEPPPRTDDPFLRGTSLLENDLSTPVENHNQVRSVANELFNAKDIALRTEVSHNEIMQLTRLDFLADRYGLQNLRTLKQDFLQLRVSMDRKSRQEFVAALKAEEEKKTGGSWISRLFTRGDTPG